MLNNALNIEINEDLTIYFVGIQIIYIFAKSIYKIYNSMAAPFKYTAKALAFAFDEYKEWVKTQGYIKPEVIKGGELAGTIVKVLIPKPLSVESFCIFAEIDIQTFYNYLKQRPEEVNKGGEEVNKKSLRIEQAHKLFETATRIQQEIKDYQLGGALAGTLNPTIAARINGLNETLNVNNSGTKETININIDGKKIDLT